MLHATLMLHYICTMKRKKNKRTSPKKNEKFTESQGRHIVVVGFDNNTISEITIVDAENEILIINKQLFN